MDHALNGDTGNQNATRRGYIIIVDDDADLLRALQIRCQAIGITAVTYTSLDEAIQSAHDEPPELIILDIHVGMANGLVARDEMLENKRLARIPVIIMSGDASHENVRHSEQGGSHFVRKGTHVWDRLKPHLARYLDVQEHIETRAA